MAQVQGEKKENSEVRKDNHDSLNTISTKLSTDRLICKTSKESPYSSVKSLENPTVKEDENLFLCLGVFQFVFGLLMVIFGGLVLHYDASLSQLGGGIWAGCLAMTTGIIGILASANEWCPLKSTPQKITHTIFLALSLVSLAVAQLVVALAATGAGRDFQNTYYDTEEQVKNTTQMPSEKISSIWPENNSTILLNFGLLTVALGECIVTAIASYKSSRVLCPCFRKMGDHTENFNAQNRNALVRSWLGKHSIPPHLYIVTSRPSSKFDRDNKLLEGLPITPVFTMPHQMGFQHRVIGCPLIPAPLGTIPSPLIPPSPPNNLHRKKRKHNYAQSIPREVASKKSKSDVKKNIATDDEVTRSYTGLDKIIAEEFIDICDSRNNSFCSDSSCSNSCEKNCKDCNNNCD